VVLFGFSTGTQWASFSKKLQKLIILAPVHIFLFPIQGICKIARGIRIWTEKFEKSLFSGSNRPLERICFWKKNRFWAIFGQNSTFLTFFKKDPF
jgi:hypothetical protein